MISSVIYFKDDDRVVFHDSGVDHIEKTFLPGFYEFLPSKDGYLCFRRSVDEIHTPFRSKENNMIIKSCIDFFSSPKIKKKVNSMGFTMKMGVLLYGKPGTGKTSLMNYIAANLANNKSAIVCICDDKESLSATIEMAKQIRLVQNNPIVVVFDEFDAMFLDKKAEADLKRFLDGSDSVDNTLFLAATNYLEYIPKTFTDRESRFRIIQEIKGIEDLSVIESLVDGLLQEADSLKDKDKVMALVKEGDTLDLIKNRVIDVIMSNKIKTTDRPTISFIKRAQEEDDDELIEFFPLWAPENKYK